MVSLSIDPPPSSRRAQHGRGLLRPLGFLAAFVVTFAGGFWLGRVTSGMKAGEGEGAKPTATAAPTASPAPTATPAPPATSTATPPTQTSPSPATSITTSRRLALTLAGSLEDTVAAALPAADRRLAEELTAVVNRVLVWDFRLARDGRKGDRIEVLWTPPRPAAPGVPGAGEPVVDALRYASSKLGSVLTVYRFQPEGSRWARYYRADGTEVEARLVDGPIDDYEQVSSLLRDGRRHKGVDFKTPVGSPVRAPFEGVVGRRNWNFAGNGNCVELLDPASGRRAIFLHLEGVPREMSPGRKVKKGEVIAASGNSGRSFAPHLHYQLEDAAGRVLDPFEVHRTVRRALDPAHRAAFEAERARLDAALGG